MIARTVEPVMLSEAERGRVDRLVAAARKGGDLAASRSSIIREALARMSAPRRPRRRRS